MSNRTRRQFLEDSMFATAAALAANSTARLYAEDPAKPKGPNEKLAVAIIGAGGRGSSHIDAFANKSDTEVTYICDADEKTGNSKADAIGKSQNGRRPKFVKDMREVFDDPSVDLVSTATPNHWHALTSIWAIQAGKDVYVEKPVSHNVSEGRRIVEAARKYNKICQCGTQSRSMKGMQETIAFIHGGGIGEVKLARGLCYKRRPSIGKLDKPLVIPENINYDLWCGPAEMVDLYRPRLHYDWHWDFNTGNGDLGNQGIHQMDIARWGLGIDKLSNNILSYGGRLGYEDAGDTANTQVCIHEYGDKTLVFEVRGLETGDYKGSKVGVIFQGTEGYVVIPSYSSATAFDKDGKVIKTFDGGGDHFGNFVKAVRSRNIKDLNAEILEGHLSSALCHMANVSYRLGSTASAAECLEQLAALKTNDDVKDTFERTAQHLADNKVDIEKTKLIIGPNLAFDPEKEVFIDNSPANAMLTRDYRAPYIVPAAGQV